jgi:hypothetical protein
MAETPDEKIKDVQQELREVVKRALVQAADLQNVEEKLKDIVERTSKVTAPPPDKSEEQK